MAKLAVSLNDKLIGKRIQLKRKEVGLTAEQLSERVDISQQQLSRYERGDNKINISHLINIAAYLETPLSWFLYDCQPDIPILDPKGFHLSCDELEQQLIYHWNKLNHKQQKNLINLLNSFHTP